jgi:putative CocE/NonD family hydrolase
MKMQDMLEIMEKTARSEFDGCSHEARFSSRGPAEFMLPMDDGVELRTVIFRPDAGGAVPTVVSRTCYPEFDGVQRIRGEEYSKRGVAYVYQYCRGTGGSGGVWEPNINERPDGKSMIDWVCGQNWVGNVGYLGCSYPAMTGWVIADILPPKVKTMYLAHYGVFRHTSAYKDGLFRHDVLTSWTMGNAGFPIDTDYLQSCLYMPHIEVDENLWGKRLDWYRDWITGADRCSSCWETGFWKMLRGIPGKVTIPVCICEGWYDHHLGSAIETYSALPEETKDCSTFVIGAWNHMFQLKLEGHSAANPETGDDVRALDWFVKLLVKNERPQGGIRAYIIGDDSWFMGKELLTVKHAEKRLYIRGKNPEGVYGLSTEKEAIDEVITYIYDPGNPVKTHGADALLHTEKDQGSLLQPEPNYRQDIVSCISGAQEKEITILGAITASLVVSTNVDDTAFMVKISEVFPDGGSVNIRTGVTTLGYRNSADSRVIYRPGDKVRISITMWDIAWKIQKGSRIRIDITSSDFPQYSIHSNYAGCWSHQDKKRLSKQRVYIGLSDDSHINLPLM